MTHTLGEAVELLHDWYPPDTAESWDAVGLIAGDPGDSVAKVAFAVDATYEVAVEAAAWGADLLVVHHPLFLKGVHGVARTTPKGRTLGVLTDAGCALLAAHTNADRAVGGVSEALALALGLSEVEPLAPAPHDPLVGTGRIGWVDETVLARFGEQVSRALPMTAHGIRVAGDPHREVRRVAVCGGAGDFLLDELATRADIDVYVTSDLRHHPAAEFVEKGGPALVDIAHWAAEWTWLPVVEARLREAWGATVATQVSTRCTDPWTFRP